MSRNLRAPTQNWRRRHTGRWAKSPRWWNGDPGNPPGVRIVSPWQAALYRYVGERLSGIPRISERRQ